MVNIKEISFSYAKAMPILNRVSFDLQDGQCLAVLGNNGAGKSTLLKCIDRILKPREGAVLVDGKNVFAMSGQEMAQQIAYVPQNSGSVQMTVFDAVLLGRKPYIKWDATEHDRRIVREILQKMHLEDFALRNMAELSGGEAQKVMLARALAQEPRLLLLDEPTSSLDPRSQHTVLQTVRAIAREHNICVILVLHDLNLAIRYCDRFLFLKDSAVFACGGPEIMTPHTIEAVYDMHVHIMDSVGIPVIVPFPDVKPYTHSHPHHHIHIHETREVLP